MSDRLIIVIHKLLSQVLPRTVDYWVTTIFNRIMKRDALCELMRLRECSKSLLSEFGRQAKLRGFASSSDRAFWLMYVQALLENQRMEDARRVIDRYFSHYPDGLDVDRCLWVSRFALMCGYEGVCIRQSAAVCELMDDSLSNDAFAEMVKGKTVALVGNGPGELGKGLGAEIDGHDIVVRVNNYKLDGFAGDVGCRTDVWVKAFFDAICHEVRSEDLSLILYGDAVSRRLLPDGYLEAMSKEMKKCRLSCFPVGVREQIVRDLAIAPTTGFLLIDLLRKTECRYFDVYGFSFLEEKEFTVYTSYTGEKQNAEAHNMQIEISFLRRLFQDGRRCYPRRMS